MNSQSDMQQLVFALNALHKIDSFLADLQVQARDELAEPEIAERALLDMRLAVQRGIYEGLGISRNKGETDER